MIKLSYIIPFYNGQDSILQCLDSILSIDLPKSDYEIIIVDDCSPVSAQSILAQYPRLSCICLYPIGSMLKLINYARYKCK